MTDGVVTTEIMERGFLTFNWMPVVFLLIGSRTCRSNDVLAMTFNCERITSSPGLCAGSREQIRRINDSRARGTANVPWGVEMVGKEVEGPAVEVEPSASRIWFSVEEIEARN